MVVSDSKLVYWFAEAMRTTITNFGWISTTLNVLFFYLKKVEKFEETLHVGNSGIHVEDDTNMMLMHDNKSMTAKILLN